VRRVNIHEAKTTLSQLILDISIRHAAMVADTRLEHDDPFDRLLLAQCEVETLRLVTADQALIGRQGVIAV
jgi:PIN domain nuclease of toxin-antitoxin system